MFDGPFALGAIDLGSSTKGSGFDFHPGHISVRWTLWFILSLAAIYLAITFVYLEISKY